MRTLASQSYGEVYATESGSMRNGGPYFVLLLLLLLRVFHSIHTTVSKIYYTSYVFSKCRSTQASMLRREASFDFPASLSSPFRRPKKLITISLPLSKKMCGRWSCGNSAALRFKAEESSVPHRAIPYAAFDSAKRNGSKSGCQGSELYPSRDLCMRGDSPQSTFFGCRNLWSVTFPSSWFWLAYGLQVRGLVFKA